MGRKFGATGRVAEFIEKMIPMVKSIGAKEQILISKTLLFLMKLDEIQESNPAFTFVFHANDGIWIYYNGLKVCFLKPTQKHILLHVFEANELSASIVKISKSKELFQNAHEADYADFMWRIGDRELDWLSSYIEKKMPAPKILELASEAHPRNIPGEVRQMALQAFENEGRRCRGVEGKVPAHIVEKSGMPIEFDHILPHSKGGSSGFLNVQVLCEKCNRLKHATSL